MDTGDRDLGAQQTWEEAKAWFDFPKIRSFPSGAPFLRKVSFEVLLFLPTSGKILKYLLGCVEEQTATSDQHCIRTLEGTVKNGRETQTCSL